MALEADGLAPSTRKRVLGTLRQVLQHALEQSELGYNPVVEYQRTRADRTEDPPAQPAHRPLDERKLAALLHAAEEQWRLAFLCAAETGLHASELLTLRWNDLTDDAVGITRHLDRAGTVAEYPEGDSRRRAIQLSRQLRQALDEHPASTHRRRTDLIFPSERGGGVRATRSYDLAFKRAAEQIGLSAKPSILRHTFAAARIREGVDLSSLARQLGNANFESFYRAYRPLIEEHDRASEAEQLRRASFNKKKRRQRATRAEPPINPSNNETILQVKGTRRERATPVDLPANLSGEKTVLPLDQVEHRTGHRLEEIWHYLERFTSIGPDGTQQEMAKLPVELLHTPDS
jgi:integrase/recombinase XerD